mmetsp:Transcript_8007/g.12368  ORF Transcript_8007/g.12368 Transcript_8007/m.12368 type:complete len:106 (-) Transcript_8007:10-327(-)
MASIRQKVFKLYGIPCSSQGKDAPHLVLMRAHYSYMKDIQFDLGVQQLKQDHEKELGMMVDNPQTMRVLEQFYANNGGRSARSGRGKQARQRSPFDSKKVPSFKF